MSIFNFTEFPDPNISNNEGLVAYGGDLSPNMLISAYIQGIYPWFNDNSEILWWSPNPRMVLYPKDFRLRKSLRQNIRKNKFQIKINANFEKVIHSCAMQKRKDQKGTWITSNMISAYTKLHKMGFAHSFETYINSDLVGGLYGLQIGKIFFGESMFSSVTDSSKFALYQLTEYCIKEEIYFIDVQQSTSHLKSMGGKDIPRKDFIEIVKEKTGVISTH